MKPLNEQTLIRRISFGMLLVAFVLFKLGITQNNGNLDIFSNVLNLQVYVTLGYIMLGCLIPFFAIRRTMRDYLILLGSGICSFTLVWLVQPAGWDLQFWSMTNFIISSSGIGLASIVLVLADKKADAASVSYKQKLIDFYIFANLLQFSAFTLLDFTTLLHPVAFDSIAYRIDNTLGFFPGAVVAQIFASHPDLSSLANFVYDWIALGFALIYVFQLRQNRMPPANMLLVWAVSTVACLIAYHFCPISGPLYLFGKDLFPHALPDPGQVTDMATVVTPTYRNGLPSMHFGTCLMLMFTARYQKSRVLHGALFFLTAIVILATLGKGEHYLIDLVVSFPFIVAIQSFCTRVSDAGRRDRLRAIGTGVALWLTWVALVRFGLVLFETIPGFIYLASLSTIVASLLAYQRLWRHEVWGVEHEIQPKRNAAAFALTGFTVPALFFVSGFTGLMYEIVFTKQLTLSFGSMATATYTVLAVYMGGMAIGSWLGGFLVSRTRVSGLVLYAMCELIIGVYCLLAPILFDLIRNAYVAFAHDVAPDAQILVACRVGFGALALLVPTILMGVTLPAMVSELRRTQSGIGNAVSRLYGANTLGAASGALLAGYLILPAIGISKTIALSAAGSMCVALLAMNLNKQHRLQAAAGDTPEADRQTTAHSTPKTVIVGAGLMAIFLTGCVTMMMEVDYMQLLAVVAGNSTYAFSLMLFSLLLGLAGGAKLARYALVKSNSVGLILSLLLLALPCVLLLGVFQWNNLPSIFAAYAPYPYHLDFVRREAIRAVLCWLVMFPPAVLIGACYPMILELISDHVGSNQKIGMLGNAIGINTLGNIVGTLLGGFVLLPMLGTQKSIQVAAATCLIGGILIAWSIQRIKHLAVLGLILATLILMAAQPASFDYTKLSSGSNVYFQYQNNGKVIAHAESLDGGLTSVAVKQSADLGEVKTLLTNGKFQGNNSLRGEMKAQLGFAVTPLLQTSYRDNALVIGYGTGVSAHAIKEAGFKQLDIVELSADLINLSNAHFANVNARVSEQAGVRSYTTDGRNFLLLQDRQYDLISMEITSIWFAGAGSLYNREFYKLAAKRLKDYGVLQQWVQLHHMTPRDLACILSTVRTEFSNVSLYMVGGQGIIVATQHAQNLSGQAAIQMMEQQPGLMHLFQQAGMTPQELQANLVLTVNDVNHLTQTFFASDDFIISTDDNSYLEYSTPKGNALDGEQSFKDMQGFLSHFSTAQANVPPH